MPTNPDKDAGYSPTWARHSFATNLNNSGRVPYYPQEKMLEYNAYLLKESKPANKKAELLELLRSMSAKERKTLMKEAEK